MITPRDVYVDTNGNIYYVDQNDHRVKKASFSGQASPLIVTTFAGNGRWDNNGDNLPATATSRIDDFTD